MTKPRVFISSTIYDFKDLRSAIKFYLTENGFEVITSENADFPNDNHNNSYQACLDAISTCDYYILLIGSRVGGKYKYINDKGKAEIITITRAEYRRAYELFKENKIKIINFVRKEIYDVREDRKGLEDVLRNFALQEDEQILIKEHESRIVKEAGEIFRFLDEVGRNSEMKAANKNENDLYPAGNWIYQFSSFNEIVSVLKNTLNINRGFIRQIWLENLRTEIIENLSCLTEKHPNGTIQVNFSLGLIDKNKLKNIDDLQLTGHELWGLYWFNLLFHSNIEKLRCSVLKSSLQSETFFDYNVEKQRLYPNKVYQFIHLLIDKIEQAQLLYTLQKSELQNLINFYKRFDIKQLYNDTEVYKVDSRLFLYSLNVAYCLKDIYNMSREFMKYYKNNNYVPKTHEELENNIFYDSNEQVKKEKVSFKELDEFFREHE